MKSLLTKLGLAEAASETEALSALDSHLKAGAELVTLLGATSPAEAAGKIAALKAEAAKAAELSAVIQAQAAAAVAQEHERLLDDGVKGMKIAPAQLAFWKTQPLDTLKGFLSVATAMVKTKGTESRENASPESANLSDADARVSAILGIKPEDFAAHKAKVGTMKIGATSSKDAK